MVRVTGVRAPVRCSAGMSRREKVRALLALAARQHGVATTQQALDAGFSHSAIARAVENGEWVRVHVGVYIVSPAADPVRGSILGHVLRAPGRAWASHASAAWLWGLSSSVPLRPQISTTANLRGGRATIRRVDQMPADHARVVQGIPVTSPERTLVDVAARIPAPRLEAMVAEAVRTKLVSVGDLRECAVGLSRRGRSGPRALLRILDAWDPAAPPESILESRLVRVIRAGGLPAPVCQFRVALGGRVARLDFAYPRQMVAIEADGYKWHGGAGRWRSDLARRNELSRLGWLTLHFTWHDVNTRPDHVVDTIRSALDLRSQTPAMRERATGEGRAT